MRPLLWRVFVRSAWAQTAIVVAGTSGEGAGVASVLFVGVSTACYCGGRQDN